MNKLFEGFITQFLTKHQSKIFRNIENKPIVVPQLSNVTTYLAKDEFGRGKIQLQPDIVLQDSLSHAAKLIIDTKYKKLDFEKIPPEKLQIAELQYLYQLDLAEKEAKGPRAILENEHFLVFAPYASITPMEFWILPKRHSPNMLDLSKAEIASFAKTLKASLKALKDLLNDPPYNYGFHLAINKEAQDYYHWHLEVYPKVAIWAGFELNTGIYINTIMPETAAESLKKVIEACLDYENCPYEVEVSILLTDDNEIQQINMEYRNIDKPTDVLSFPVIEYETPGDFTDFEDVMPECFHPETGELMLGDIVISVERALLQAEEYGHSMEREIAFLTAHSMFHLFGYDHMEENERIIMEDKQNQVLEKLQIYR